MSAGFSPRRFPLRYARANVLFGREGGRAALYRLSTVSYLFLPEGEKEAALARLARFALAVQADFSLWRVPRAYPASQYAAQAEPLFDERYADRDAWEAYLEGHAERLRELRSTVPEVYLAVSLSARTEARLGAGMLRDWDQARRRIEALVGAEARTPVLGSELYSLAESEQRLFDRLRNIFPAHAPIERARTGELQWLLRRAPCRGVAEPKLDTHWQPRAQIIEGADGEPVYEPLETTLFQAVNAPIDEQESHLVVDAQEGRSYQAMLTLGALPEDPEFPGPRAELLFAPLEAVDFPVDVVLHATWQGNRQALSAARKGVMDAENVYREQVEGSEFGPDWHAEENRALARELESYLKSDSRPPMLHARTSLALGAPGLKALEQRVDVLAEQYGDVTLWQPRGLQSMLWYDHLPRTDGGTVGDYDEPVTIEQFGGLMPIGTHVAGSRREVASGLEESGLHIGYTLRGRRPIRHDSSAAPRRHRPTGIFMCGTPGSGKTTAASLLAYQAALKGEQVVAVDPKPDWALEFVPELEGMVEIIELSGDEANAGKLDPMRVAVESMREDIAADYYLSALRDPPAAQENAIRRAVLDVVRAGEASSLAVLDRLREMARGDHETAGHAARDAAEGLANVADFGVGRLAFGDGNGGELRAQAAAPVTIIRPVALNLPEPEVDRAAYDHKERVAAATLGLVNSFALRLVQGDRHRHKTIVFDEVYFLLATPQGRALLWRLVRAGRALNATVILASQRMADLGDLRNLIGEYFIFGQESDEDARVALEAVGLDPEDRALRQMVRYPNYREGLCLMRDLDGRVAELQIDLVYEHLRDAFDTSPAGARTRADMEEATR